VPGPCCPSVPAGLKEAFDLSLEEIAEALSTSVGAVKAALHRGRGKLAEPDEAATAAPSAPVLDAFCAAFNAGDLERLVALVLDTASVEVVRVHAEYGRDAARKGVFQVIVHWYAHADGEAVRALTRVETSGDRLSRVRNHFYTPDVIAEVCGELGLPYRINGHRYW
jgi:RNA polymerase sigma-70 factor (ECF subfamily)